MDCYILWEQSSKKARLSFCQDQFLLIKMFYDQMKHCEEEVNFYLVPCWIMLRSLNVKVKLSNLIIVQFSATQIMASHWRNMVVSLQIWLLWFPLASSQYVLACLFWSQRQQVNLVTIITKALLRKDLLIYVKRSMCYILCSPFCPSKTDFLFKDSFFLLSQLKSTYGPPGVNKRS